MLFWNVRSDRPGRRVRRPSALSSMGPAPFALEARRLQAAVFVSNDDGYVVSSFDPSPANIVNGVGSSSVAGTHYRNDVNPDDGVSQNQFWDSVTIGNQILTDTGATGGSLVGASVSHSDNIIADVTWFDRPPINGDWIPGSHAYGVNTWRIEGATTDTVDVHAILTMQFVAPDPGSNVGAAAILDFDSTQFSIYLDQYNYVFTITDNSTQTTYDLINDPGSFASSGLGEFSGFSGTGFTLQLDTVQSVSASSGQFMEYHSINYAGIGGGVDPSQTYQGLSTLSWNFSAQIIP